MKRKVPEKTKNKTKVGVWVNMLHKMLFFFILSEMCHFTYIVLAPSMQ